MNSMCLSLILFALIIASTLGGGPSMPSCEEWCTEEYDPVCASNGEDLTTFGNNCELSRFNCVNNEAFEVLYEGECKQATCQKDCPPENKPFCAAKDDQQFTFLSECRFEIVNCKNKGAFKILHEGKCGPSGA